MEGQAEKERKGLWSVAFPPPPPPMAGASLAIPPGSIGLTFPASPTAFAGGRSLNPNTAHLAQQRPPPRHFAWL